MTDHLAIVALAISALVAVLLTGFTVIFLCLWCRTRKELLILKRRVYYEATVNKPELTKPNPKPLPSGIVELHSPSPPAALPPKQEDPPIPIDARSKSVSSNYHAVNNIAILPDELRTPANLEPGELSEKKGQQLMDDYLKKRAQYEENQLAKAGEAAVVPPGYEVVSPARDPTFPAVKSAGTTAGYEDIDPIEDAVESLNNSSEGEKPNPRIGAYNNPADYLPPDHSLMEGLKSSSAPSQKKFVQVSTSVDEYTEVFDSLLSSGEQVVGVKVRAMSESRPRGRTSPAQSGHVTGPAVGSVGNVNGFDSTRQSKRDSVKEIVELDFGNKKKFRVANKKGKEFTDGERVEESYAMVNLADKQRYRAESDSLKKEGSGAPLRYEPGAVVVAT